MADSNGKTRKEELYILIGGAILLVAVVVVGILTGGTRGAKYSPFGAEGAEGDATSTATAEQQLQETGYTSLVPRNAVETPPAQTVQVVTDPTKDESLGVYRVVASRSGYEPNELVVVEGNIVSVTFTSAGAQYDLYIPAMGVYITAPDGVEKQTSFRVPQSGTFKITCKDYCPGGSTIEGVLVVKPK